MSFLVHCLCPGDKGITEMEPLPLTSSDYIELYRNDGLEMICINILGCDACVGS